MAAPIVSYTCFWKEYKNQSSLYSNPHPNIWDKIELYCSEDNPNNFVINSFINKYFWLTFALIWLIFLCIPLWIIFYWIRRKKFIEYIKLNWKILEVPIVFIWLNKNLTVNWKNPSIFEVQYLDNFNNSVYTFRSDNIWYNLDQFIKIWDFVKVYVDERNYKSYWVDTSFLPNKN
jgi:hypothetical protein